MPAGSDVTVGRKAVRKAIAAGLAANMPTAQVVYDYQKSDFDQQSPVVRVFSAGSNRPSMTARGNRSRFTFSIELWVLYANSGSWNEADAEDALDDLEQELVQWVSDNQVGDLWTALKFERPSLLGNVIVGGAPYLVEDITLVAEVYG